MAGLSGLSLYVPRPRVTLDAWCDWTGSSPDKVRAVIGDAFRVPAGHEDVYTLAANAIIRLLDNYDIDPGRVGYLVLATESSLDNAVGGPTVRGLVDAALKGRGHPGLPRDIETFEMKQACLSGINGLLAATRFVTLEPERYALVVASDIAEYARGSSGEQTQGAGAVAMWVESQARLLDIELSTVGRSSADRVCDFRKPMRAPRRPLGSGRLVRPQDFPAFAGHYSTHCYLEAVDRAFLHLLERRQQPASELLDRASMILLHRPYDKMPLTSVARLLLRKMRAEGRDLQTWAAEAGIPLGEALADLDGSADLAERVLQNGLDVDPTPALSKLTKALARADVMEAFISAKCGAGRGVVRQLGNLYSASLPAWMGAAFEEAAEAPDGEEGSEVLLLGYGSGDASLAVMGRLVPGWQSSARALGFSKGLAGALDIDRESYERAHDRIEEIAVPVEGEVMLSGLGDGESFGFDDRGIPRYAYVADSLQGRRS